MKKFAKTLVLIVLSMCIAFTIVACANNNTASDFSYSEEYESNGITLGLYEELDLLPIDGNAEGITLTSADDSIVSINGNRLIAKTEGVTTVTATKNKKSKTLTVRVYDDGAKLSIATDQDVVYVGSETDLGFHVMYKQKSYAYDADYRLTIPDEYASIAEVRDGKIYGKAEGTIKVKVTLEDYKGVEVKGEFTFNVCPVSFVEVASDTISLYNAKDSKLATAKIEQTVHYNAKQVPDAEVIYEVTDGADKIAVDEEGNVTAKAEGTATVKVKYASDESVFAEVTVNVNPNYIETQFFKSGIDGQDYAEYTGTEEIGGRKDGIFEYTQGSGSVWDSRMSYAEAGDSIVENARKGYKYFGYDLYFGGSQIYIGLDHADCQWFGAGSYLRTDYMQVIDCETGAIINRLERNKWIRIVYNLDYYLNNTEYVSFAETGFFYAQDGTAGSHSYIDNVRWYLDDEYYDHDAEDNVKYTLNDDGTISATNNEWTFDTTEVTYNGEIINTESTYAPAGKEIDGVSGAWKFAPVTVTRPNKDDASQTQPVFNNWENQLKLVSATAYKNSPIGDTGYNENGMRNLTEGIAKKVGASVDDSVESKYKFVTFDLYVEKGDSFSIHLNHVNIGGNINLGTTMEEEGYVDGGTDLSTKASYLKAWKMGSDKLAYYIEKGNWYTISLAYFDNYDPSAWACNIIFMGNGGNVYYINNVKYHKTMDGVAPTEYAGFKPVSGLSMLDNTKASGQTLSWVYADEAAEKGSAFEGALKFKTNEVSDSWDKSRLGFDGVVVNGAFFSDGMKYIVADVYFDENIASLSAFTWATYQGSWEGAQYAKSIELGKTTEMYLYENGARVKGNVEANKWYKLVIPVDYQAMPQWCVASVEIKAKDASVAAYTYFNNITYTKDIPYECKDLVITTKPETVAWRDMAGDDTAETKTYALSYTATPGLDVEWSSSNEDVATVENGTIIFKRDKWGQYVTITATATVSEGVTITDSFTVQLVNAPSNLGAGSDVSIYYGTGDEIIVKTSTTYGDDGWGAKVKLYDICAEGDKPVASWRNNGYKYIAMDILLGDGAKGIRSCMWLNTGNASDEAYLTVGETAPTAKMFVFDATTKAKVYGTIEANKWYTIYIATDYTNANTNWGQAFINVWSNASGVEGTIKIKNVTPVTEITGTYDLRMTNKPENSVDYSKLTNSELQLGVNATEGLELVWETNNADYATVDSTGKVTVKTAAVGNNVTVTVSGKLNNSVVISDSATFAVTAGYDKLIVTGGINSSIVYTAGGTNTVQLGLANGEDAFGGYTWTVSDSEVATVTNGLVTFLKTGSVNVTVTPVVTNFANLATTVTLKAVTSEEKQNEWHFDSTDPTWVSDGDFANSWHSTSSDVKVAGSSSDASNATYIMFEIYVVKGAGLNYHSNMYTANKTTYWWSWGTSINENTKYYEMDGTLATNLESGKWYKVVFNKAKEGTNVTWGESALMLDAVDGETEFYFRNAIYGDTIPAGWINE